MKEALVPYCIASLTTMSLVLVSCTVTRYSCTGPWCLGAPVHQGPELYRSLVLGRYVGTWCLGAVTGTRFVYPWSRAVLDKTSPHRAWMGTAGGEIVLGKMHLLLWARLFINGVCSSKRRTGDTSRLCMSCTSVLSAWSLVPMPL